MPFTPKTWVDETDPLGPPADSTTDTPLNAAALVDLETRLSDYADTKTADLAVTSRMLANLARTGGWLPSGAIAETFPREFCISTLALTSGRLQLTGGIVVPGGRLVSTISVFAHGTGATTPTNQWACLVERSTGNVLVKTTDLTTTAWATNTVQTFTISGGYTPVSAIEVYVGIVVVAATPPSVSRPGSASGAAIGTGGGMGDSSTTGLTNPASLGATVSVPGGQTAFYAYIS